MTNSQSGPAGTKEDTSSENIDCRIANDECRTVAGSSAASLRRSSFDIPCSIFDILCQESNDLALPGLTTNDQCNHLPAAYCPLPTAIAAGARRSQSRKVVPALGRLVTSMRPPMLSKILRAMARPSPVPEVRVV